MPRESVTAVGGSEFSIHVGWSLNGSVQVATEMADGKSMFWQLLGSDAERLGAEVRKVVAEANEPGPKPLGDNAIGENVLNAIDVIAPTYRGLWADLDRAGVNRLIRILRKARDAAFGRDE